MDKLKMSHLNISALLLLSLEVIGNEQDTQMHKLTKLSMRIMVISRNTIWILLKSALKILLRKTQMKKRKYCPTQTPLKMPQKQRVH